MAGKKSLYETRNQIVSTVALAEDTTDEASINAYRRAFKRLLQMGVKARQENLRAPITVLLKEEIAMFKKAKSK